MTAAWASRSSRPSYAKAKRSTVSGLPHKRSGPEHDLTSWLDDIPPRFALFRDIRHGLNSLPFSDGKKTQRYPGERVVQCVLHRPSLEEKRRQTS